MCYVAMVVGSPPLVVMVLSVDSSTDVFLSWMLVVCT